MATHWSGTTSFPVGQTAVAETVVRASDNSGFTIVLTLDSPAFELTCIYDGSRFFCETEGYDFLVAAEELDMSPEALAYRVRITFISEAGGPTTAEWNITAGNANLESSSLTAE